MAVRAIGENPRLTVPTKSHEPVNIPDPGNEDEDDSVLTLEHKLKGQDESGVVGKDWEG